MLGLYRQYRSPLVRIPKKRGVIGFEIISADSCPRHVPLPSKLSEACLSSTESAIVVSKSPSASGTKTHYTHGRKKRFLTKQQEKWALLITHILSLPPMARLVSGVSTPAPEPRSSILRRVLGMALGLAADWPAVAALVRLARAFSSSSGLA